jgi:cytochrome c553
VTSGNSVVRLAVHLRNVFGGDGQGRTRGSRLTLAAILNLIVPLGLVAHALWLQAGSHRREHIPTNVTWTDETIAEASRGDALHGMLLARRCDHCHGAEGFSPNAYTPNLAAIDKLATWKQLEDFRSHKRGSSVMEPVAASLTPRDLLDLATYYAMLPDYSDPQDTRSFPQRQPEYARAQVAARLVSAGDGERGIPPCQACHGPVGYRPGAASLATQNSDYILGQLDAFGNGARANDINLVMRTIAHQLSEEERRSLADYYGSGLGLLPPAATVGH